MEYQIKFAFKGVSYPDGSHFICERALLTSKYDLVQDIIYSDIKTLPDGNMNKRSLHVKLQQLIQHCKRNVQSCQIENYERREKDAGKRRANGFRWSAESNKNLLKRVQENVMMQQEFLLELLSNEDFLSHNYDIQYKSMVTLGTC